ncbi:hypothetical protein A9Q84_13875 [Halobacteriovorax marinus]|uniref:Secreted protein n=1 Tax=Halobacteriovorax marinus TaxID=97084 RepID=A0A1Y5FEJ5_9BACT|nr:hypothetical protein A9Q84_13875 [Halobacteriovorax marinus]
MCKLLIGLLLIASSSSYASDDFCQSQQQYVGQDLELRHICSTIEVRDEREDFCFFSNNEKTKYRIASGLRVKAARGYPTDHVYGSTSTGQMIFLDNQNYSISDNKYKLSIIKRNSPNANLRSVIFNVNKDSSIGHKIEKRKGGVTKITTLNCKNILE